jgi:hypothetical protein
MGDWSELRGKSERGATLSLKPYFCIDGFLSLVRTEHKHLTPQHIMKAREYATKAVAAWRIMKLSVTPKCHASEDHACDQLELLKGLVADFCEDWVEQLHQLGLKNNRRTFRSGEGPLSPVTSSPSPPYQSHSSKS